MKRKSRLPLILGVLAIGILIGAIQGYNQCERNWEQKVKERSTCYEQEGPVPIYEDASGNIYYSHREERGTGYAMIPNETQNDKIKEDK